MMTSISHFQIKEASLQSMPPELRLQMSYQYTCNRTSRPTGRDCEQDNNMPGHCCDKDTHKQSVTVEIMFVSKFAVPIPLDITAHTLVGPQCKDTVVECYKGRG